MVYIACLLRILAGCTMTPHTRTAIVGRIKREMKTENNYGVMCSWCRRVKDSELGWIFPSAEEEPSIPGPLTSHGLCDDCYSDILDEFMLANEVKRYGRPE